MIITFSSRAEKKLTQIRKRDSRLFNKIRKKIKLFLDNPDHPSLRLHKLKGELKNSWSISVTMSFRILFYYPEGESETITIYMLGKHDEVY